MISAQKEAQSYGSLQVFVLQGDWEPNKKAILEFVLFGIDEIVYGALDALADHGAANPSFQRYFQTGEFNIVRRMFERIIGYTQAPGSEQLYECDKDAREAPKMWVFQGDPPGLGSDDCATGASRAYHGSLLASDSVEHPFIAICSSFWNTRLHQAHAGAPGYPYVHDIGTSIDNGQDKGMSLAESVSSVLLHGMLLELRLCLHTDAL